MLTEKDLKTVLDRVASHSRNEFGSSLKDIILYGSYARGDQEDGSDIDIMIVIDEKPERLREYRRSFSRLASNLDLEYGIAVSTLLKYSETFEYWKEVLPFYRSVDTEGVRIVA